MFMKRTLISLLFVVILALSFSMPAFAANASVTKLVEQANKNIDQLIAKAEARADQCYATYQSRVNVEKALLAKNASLKAVVNDRIKQYTNEYHLQLDDIGNNLIRDAYNKVLDLYNATLRSQVDFACEYIPVQLGDRIYMVDPLRIVGR